ncbi:MAG: glycosyltransferase [Rubellimicrobium sp.]|nr:glycosyltransferase [Rubellimicrobium sp.]
MILMATCNGAAFLPAQLASIAAQNHPDWSLIARDDGSTDATPGILADFARAHPGRDIRLIRGRGGAGSAGNFLSLLADPDLPEGFVAFADQDDVWLPDKIARGLALLARAQVMAGAARPAVYASRTILADAALRPQRLSTLHRRPPAFGNALVQNVLGGNTILLDPAAAALMRASCAAALGRDVPFHDWWVYQVVTGAGGIAINDAAPGLLYRQHGANALGAHRGLSGGRTRLGMIRNSLYSSWIDRNLAALAQVRDLLDPAGRARLEGFAALRQEPRGITRARGLRPLGIHRQTRSGDLILQGLALAGKL